MSKKFKCKNDRGLTVRGTIYGKTNKKKPVVVLCHGFMANQSMCKTYAKLLEDLGYIAITIDFCGGGLLVKSDGKHADMTVYTEKEDLLSVVKYLQKQKYTKSISLLGCSQGGFVSMLVAKEIPEQIEKLIVLYPALCIPDDARSGKMMFFKFDPENIPDVLGRFPMTIGGDYARVVVDQDYRDMIGGYDGPVLYLHGTKDKIVDLSYAREAHELYPNCEYHEIKGGGHMFRGKADKRAQTFIKYFMK